MLKKQAHPGITYSANYDIDGTPSPDCAIFAQFHAALQGLPGTASLNRSSDVELRPIQGLLPDLGKDMAILRHHKSTRQEIILAQGNDLLVLLDYSSPNLRIYVAAPGVGMARHIANEIAFKVPQRPEPDPDVVQIAIWQLTAMGNPTYKWKSIRVPKWDEVSKNYPGEVHDALANYVQMREPEDRGKIILWHGAPGTGKTSAIRMLMREWKNWCSFHYVSDPEKLFDNPGYLLEVGSSDDAEQWRLVIAEDTDAFLRVDAMATQQGAMSRLLNFSDGILGQGSNTIFLLTTNASITELNAAITRPGRCLGHNQFHTFTPAQVKEWMPAGIDAPDQQMTLAELVEHVRIAADGADVAELDEELETTNGEKK